MTNERKSSNLVKSHEVICHFMRLYLDLVPLPPYKYCFLRNFNTQNFCLQVIYRGQSHPVNNLNLAEILPDTDHYMTYEGSTTYPGCWETVTWIVMNKPIYISRQV